MAKKTYVGSMTYALLRAEGWAVIERTERIERMGPYMTRKDLFGFGDLLAVHREYGLLIVQETASGSSARIKKITGDPEVAPKALEWLLAAPLKSRIEVWSWRKYKLKRGGKAERWGCVRFNIERDVMTGKLVACELPGPTTEKGLPLFVP